MPEKPRLQTEINNIASLFTLVITQFLLTLIYWITDVQEEHPHTV